MSETLLTETGDTFIEGVLFGKTTSPMHPVPTFYARNGEVFSVACLAVSALAAAGGILYSLNYQAIDPLMGVLPGLKAFVAAVLGGIGNIPGAALGGLVLGIIEIFVKGSRWSTYTDAIAFTLLILILLFRPAGLLGKMRVEKV